LESYTTVRGAIAGTELSKDCIEGNVKNESETYDTNLKKIKKKLITIKIKKINKIMK